MTRITHVLKSSLILTSSLFFLSSCADDEKYILPQETPVAVENVISAANTNTESTTSLNIVGIHMYADKVVSCKTCKYIVPANTSLIDGEKLEFNPGDVICLDAAVKYGSLDFINLNGEIEKPIVIATCDRNLE